MILMFQAIGLLLDAMHAQKAHKVFLRCLFLISLLTPLGPLVPLDLRSLQSSGPRSTGGPYMQHVKLNAAVANNITWPRHPDTAAIQSPWAMPLNFVIISPTVEYVDTVYKSLRRGTVGNSVRVRK